MNNKDVYQDVTKAVGVKWYGGVLVLHYASLFHLLLPCVFFLNSIIVHFSFVSFL